jgi:NAD(P)-dependent dehydrogenase (short-subunit alcohol dehydrogenase family)
MFSNAAARITPDEPPRTQVRGFVATDNLGTTRVLRRFVPLLRDGGRFFVVASSFGTLRSLPGNLHDRFDDPSLTLDALDETMAAYVEDVERGRNADRWPDWINIPSKVGQVAAARIAARDLREQGRDGVLLAAVCPGLVDTAASRPWFDDMTQAQSPEAAAANLIPLALDDAPPNIHGELVQFGRVLAWR